MLLEKERERDKKNCKRREKRKNENLVFDVTFFDRRRRFLRALFSRHPAARAPDARGGFLFDGGCLNDDDDENERVVAFFI